MRFWTSQTLKHDSLSASISEHIHSTCLFYKNLIKYKITQYYLGISHGCQIGIQTRSRTRAYLPCNDYNDISYNYQKVILILCVCVYMLSAEKKKSYSNKFPIYLDSRVIFFFLSVILMNTMLRELALSSFVML